MCEQTNAYDDGDIVWVKLSNCWWPCEVYEDSRLPPDLVASLKKKPFAIVKFFQEDSYEYVKNINNIYKYQCSRKLEFIRKGLDLHKSKNKYMEKFPGDVTIAEKRTEGDVELVKSIQSSPQKGSSSAWQEVFSDGKEKKGKKTPAQISPKKGRKSAATTPVGNTISPLTKTFIGKPREHEIKFLSGASVAAKTTTDSTAGLYKCHACNFSCNRINVIVLHSKIHTNEGTSSQSKVSPKSKPKITIPKIVTPPEPKSEDETPKISKKPKTRTPVVKPPKKRGKRKLSESLEEVEVPVAKIQKEKVEKVPEVKQPVKKRKTDLEWKNELLADWSEDEELDRSSTNVSAQANETEPEKDNKPKTTPEIEKTPLASQIRDEVKSPPIKYRNIPKKDRRDIVLETGELLEINRPNTSTAAVPIPAPPTAQITETPEKPWKEPLAPTESLTSPEIPTRRSSRRKTKTSISDDDDILKNKSNSSPKQQNNDKLPRLKDTNESSKNEDVSLPPMQTDESPKNEDVNLPPMQTDEESGNNSTTGQSPTKSISCFDFQDEEEEVVLDSITKHRQKKLQASELLSEKKSREPSRDVDERDEKLSSDIESLLKATIIPQVLDTPGIPKSELSEHSSPPKESVREIVLPPKERGKRIFKSKNRAKSNSSEIEDDKKSPKGKLRESTEEIHESGGIISPVKAPTESDLQIAQTLINLPDHTPPLSSAKGSKKGYADFSDCKETNAAEVLMNLGNLTETRSKSHSKKSEGEYTSSRKTFTTTVGETKIKLPENITVTKVVKSPHSSPNQTKNQYDFGEKCVADESEKVKERGRQKKIVPKKRKPNIEEVEEVIDEQSQLRRSIEPLERPMIQSPPASPKKIIKLKSQMKSTNSGGDDDIFDISNIPIVITDEPVEKMESYSIIMPETKPRTSTATSNGREQQPKIIMKIRKTDDILINKSTLLKRVRTISGSPQLHSDDGSAEEGGGPAPKYCAEKRLIKMPPKKVKSSSLEMSKASSPVMMVAHSKPTSPTKILFTSEKRLASSRESSSSSLAISTKSQVVQAKSGGQIVITSKGTVLTTSSDPIRTSSPSRVANMTTSLKLADSSKLSTSKLTIKSPAKIHVQSQQILYRPPKDVEKIVPQTVYIQQPMDVETTRTESVESQQKKVFRRIKRPRRLEVVDSTNQLSTKNTQEKSTHQTIVVHEMPPLAPISNESLGTNCVKKVAIDETDSQTIRLKTSGPASPVKTINKTEIVLEASGMKSTNLTSRAETMTTDSKEICSSVQALENQSNIQDSQLLAIPGESFGGPTNSFFLCTLENGTFTPIDNQPLYLDASNQLVPHPPDIFSSATVGAVGDAVQQGLDTTTVLELQENDQVVVEGEQVDAGENGDTKYVLSTGNGQQILLDQQSLLAIAAGDLPRLMTPEGQELILEGSSPQDILSSITLNQAELGILTDGQQIIVPEVLANSPNQDILAAALAGTEVFPSDTLIADVPQIPATNAAQVSETNAVLTQPPIMSTLEVPTKKEKIAPNAALDAGFPAQNLDDSLAVIGVTGHQTNVPTSLELPITVTNPAIAPKTTTSPISLTSIYLPSVSSSSSSQISPSIPIVEEIFSATSNVLELYPSGQGQKKVDTKNLNDEVEEMQESLDDIIEETTIESDNTCEVDSISGNDIVPVTPESITNHDGNMADLPFNDDDGNSSHSSEIPIQPDLILRPEDFPSPRTDSGGNIIDSVSVTSEEDTNLLDNLTTSTATVSCADSMSQNADGEMGETSKDHTKTANTS
ncbi:hypothetical protein DMENIID0001_052540 [Sergentomyia squamirostris]